MHYIHAILVKLRLPDARPEEQSLDDLRAHARGLAEKAIARYGSGDVWDWYSKEDAGRWAHVYPPVLLGREDRSRFVALLDEFRDLPRRAALERLALALYDDDRFRTPEEIAATRDCEAFPTSLMVYPFEGPKGQIYSGICHQPPVLDYEFLELAFAEQGRDSLYFARASDALAMACGTYDSASQFYSAEDEATRISPDTMEEVQTHPEQFALAFFDFHN